MMWRIALSGHVGMERGGKGFKKNWGKNINKYDIYEQTFQT